ncbi:hypothetical protein Ahy_A03g016102 isoform E [Arachis hypogaea]|uniref:Uncharacterized protein n=1 Tax=Arachis hypogaea TaxID=3818 RepID=A0A445E294_ARAHY|nr:hypothetical protein Ahy_A03g016102 isoform E [Arachis hypogaea]
MMYLKKPLWSQGKPEPDAKTTTAADRGGAVEELVDSLQQQRVYREVTLALRTGLRDARAEFSFLRVRGLRNILKFLRSVAESDSTIDLFNRTQSIPQLQVVPVLFEHCLRETGDYENENRVRDLNHIFGVEPLKLTSPATDAEVALALRVLEGCCLLHPQSTALAHQHNAIPLPSAHNINISYSNCCYSVLVYSNGFMTSCGRRFNLVANITVPEYIVTLSSSSIKIRTMYPRVSLSIQC